MNLLKSIPVRKENYHGQEYIKIKNEEDLRKIFECKDVEKYIGVQPGIFVSWVGKDTCSDCDELPPEKAGSCGNPCWNCIADFIG